MKSQRFVAFLTGLFAAIGAANAGGYSRGTADTDLLFEEGNFNMRVGMSVVMPQRKYKTLTAPVTGGSVFYGLTPGQTYAATDGKYSQTYEIPSMAVKFNIAEDLRCAGTYTQPFGADSEYGPQAVLFGMAGDGTGTIREGFTTDEFGLTCGYKFDLPKGRAWLIGGGFLQNFDYSQTVQFAPFVPGVPLNSTGTLAFKDEYQPGYRIGVAYEIPEIALRAQLLYRSEVQHSPSGGAGDTFTVRLADGTPVAPSPRQARERFPSLLN